MGQFVGVSPAILRHCDTGWPVGLCPSSQSHHWSEKALLWSCLHVLLLPDTAQNIRSWGEDSNLFWRTWTLFSTSTFELMAQKFGPNWRNLNNTKLERVIDHSLLTAFWTCLEGNDRFLAWLKQITAVAARRAISNTTMAFSNMIGPQEEVGFYGHQITYLAPSVYGHPHASSLAKIYLT